MRAAQRRVGEIGKIAEQRSCST